MFNPNEMKAGELAALYILAMRGYYTDHTPNEIQYALEALVGDKEALEAIRKVRTTMDSI